MKKATIFFSVLFVLAALFFAGCKKSSTNTAATPYNISATMTGAQEVPANATPGTGTVTGTYDPGTKVLTYVVSWSGLTGAATGAHFHGPAAAGVNAAVIVPLTINGTSANGTTTLTDAQQTDLLAGKWYANVHTAANPGGEIRGQVSATR